jgi:hypothetical protein
MCFISQLRGRFQVGSVHCREEDGVGSLCLQVTMFYWPILLSVDEAIFYLTIDGIKIYNTLTPEHPHNSMGKG